MATSIRFRARQGISDDWVQGFTATIGQSDALQAASITLPIPQPGLAAIDPTVTVALIAAGAKVLAALIAAFVASQRAAQMRETSETPLVIIIDGSKGSLRLAEHTAADVLAVTAAIESAVHIGEVREVAAEAL